MAAQRRGTRPSFPSAATRDNLPSVSRQPTVRSQTQGFVSNDDNETEIAQSRRHTLRSREKALAPARFGISAAAPRAAPAPLSIGPGTPRAAPGTPGAALGTPRTKVSRVAYSGKFSTMPPLANSSTDEPSTQLSPSMRARHSQFVESAPSNFSQATGRLHQSFTKESMASSSSKEATMPPSPSSSKDAVLPPTPRGVDLMEVDAAFERYPTPTLEERGYAQTAKDVAAEVGHACPRCLEKFRSMEHFEKHLERSSLCHSGVTSIIGNCKLKLITACREAARARKDCEPVPKISKFRILSSDGNFFEVKMSTDCVVNDLRTEVSKLTRVSKIAVKLFRRGLTQSIPLVVMGPFEPLALHCRGAGQMLSVGVFSSPEDLDVKLLEDMLRLPDFAKAFALL